MAAPTLSQALFLGVDVGTTSARAGIFDGNGHLLGTSAFPIQTWNESGCFEQSTTDIWNSVCSAVHSARQASNVDPSRIRGIGFTATCSLVAIGAENESVSVSKSRDANRNVVLWMDHRAVQQAQYINENAGQSGAQNTNLNEDRYDIQNQNDENGAGSSKEKIRYSSVLKFVGGKISPEMEPPKLMWIKQNLPDSWRKAKKWMDLGDWLTFKASNEDSRSLCTLVCKWGYKGHAHAKEFDNAIEGSMPAIGWDDSFWTEIGLEDLIENGYEKIGTHVCFGGQNLGQGLTPASAQELGLTVGTPVSSCLIDAHCGALGNILVASQLARVDRKREGVNLIHDSIESNKNSKIEHENSAVGDGSNGDDTCETMILVSGTSNCHMFFSHQPIFVEGVWGPYWSVILPNYWINEGGQTASGSLLHHLLHQYPSAYEKVKEKANVKGISAFELIDEILHELSSARGCPFKAYLTKDIHILPDFHGNRSPFADPHSSGMICGLKLEQNEEQFCVHYLALLQSLAYGTKQIIKFCNNKGHSINKIIVCGGFSKNHLFLEQLADITRCQVAVSRESESVLLGAAILGATASKLFADMNAAASKMSDLGQVFIPFSQEESNHHLQIDRFHEAKYQVFEMLYEHQQMYRTKMETV